MKGDPKVIEALNEILTGELTAINQYFLHARMCKNWGYERIAKKVWAESIDEMKHAQEITDRILFLEGIPNLQKLGKLNIGETVPEQFESDLKLEYIALSNLKNAVKIADDARDYTSRDLFEKILADEEGHVDWLEMQLGLIKELGKAQYLAEQIKDS
jgi:bacterioferritin